MDKTFQRKGTRISPDGGTVFVRLRISRINYEFARSRAAFHAKADPAGTAEEQIEGYVGTTLANARQAADWQPPPEIAGQIEPDSGGFKRVTENEAGLPF